MSFRFLLAFFALITVCVVSFAEGFDSEEEEPNYEKILRTLENKDSINTLFLKPELLAKEYASHFDSADADQSSALQIKPRTGSKLAFEFFKAHTAIDYQHSRGKNPKVVRYQKGFSLKYVPLDDDHLIFVDDEGEIRDRKGRRIPEEALFDENGDFKGYQELKPCTTRPIGRTLYGDWLCKFYKRGHAFIRRVRF